MPAPTGPWVKRLSRGSEGPVPLFCFPYAGGGAGAFRSWSRLLAPEVGLYAIQLPGREARIAEPALGSLDPIVEQLTPALADEVDGAAGGSPYVFFGHSLGALVAFAVCREFHRDGVPLPEKLVASGARAPHIPQRRPPIHALPDQEFIDELRRLEGTPEEALGNAELMELLIPMLRADSAVSETYEHKEGPPLPCPIVAFGGEDDEDVLVDDVTAWSEHTSAGFEHRIFPGGHFFVHTHEADVLKELTKHLGHAHRSP
ncbi:MAG TPA: alpha/beta fold hydrolase [Actinomycetota bacterium]|nr:alpha/beta fold hydrolase [Actinomycetota bacterium]